MDSFESCLYTHPPERGEDPVELLDGLILCSTNDEEAEAQRHEASVGDHVAGQSVPA